MHHLYIILGLQITVGVIEFIVSLLGALVLGFFIHFFLTSRSFISQFILEPPELPDTTIRNPEDWHGKYLEELELREQLQRQLEEAKSNEELLTMEMDEMRNSMPEYGEGESADVDAEAGDEAGEQSAFEDSSHEYLARLRSTQESLKEQNRNITLLLEQIEQLKRSEQKHLDTLKANEILQNRVQELQQLLLSKENDEQLIQQQEILLKEMKDRLDTANADFNSLHERLHHLESKLAGPHNRSFEYEELQQNYFRLTKEFDELKLKHLAMLEENQRLTRLLTDTEDKLREANFQRQQLQKKNGFLEELNNDLQQINDQNKKLGNQLKRISEIEVMLARVSARKHEGEEEGSVE